MQGSEVDASSQGALYIPDMHIPDTFGETRPSNAGGDLRIPDMLSEYLHFFLPDGELVQDTDELVQDKPSVMAGARARPHAGAAAHQQSFRELGFARRDPHDDPRDAGAAAHQHSFRELGFARRDPRDPESDPHASWELNLKDRPSASAGCCANHPLDEINACWRKHDCTAACARATPVGATINKPRHAATPDSEFMLQDDKFFDDFQCHLGDLAAARYMWLQASRGSPARIGPGIGRHEPHPWSAGGV